ncbi:hypothetical protein [Butyrivibrio sp. FCS014]|uniref:hypothetical protein n=1 Tax=Butyrivibrio sp. FCS014 TaxID=1408304 RepID=UPI000467ECA5|nr:hypothetical protein [Butyrivibrio sp. FCS014]
MESLRGSYFEFIVTGNANVTIETSSTGGSNTSKVALVRVSGDAKTTVSNNENIEFVTGTSKATLTYYGLGEGTYRFVSPEDTTLNRGARVYKITVVQKGGEAVVQERKAWGEVAAPVIDKISLSEDGKTINVKFTVETGYDGADSVTAVMYDAKTDEKVMNASQGRQWYSNIYSFRIRRVLLCVAAHRIDEEDKNSDKSENLKFVLPLAAPGIKVATNKGAGKVVLKFYSVPEATSYSIVTTDLSSAAGLTTKAAYTPSEVVTNNKTEYSYIFTSLTVGNEYKLAVIANRDRVEENETITDVSEESSVNITVTKGR